MLTPLRQSPFTQAGLHPVAGAGCGAAPTPGPAAGLLPRQHGRVQQPSPWLAHSGCTMHELCAQATVTWAHLAWSGAAAPKVPGLSVLTRLHVSPVNRVLLQSQYEVPVLKPCRHTPFWQGGVQPVAAAGDAAWGAPWGAATGPAAGAASGAAAEGAALLSALTLHVPPMKLVKVQSQYGVEVCLSVLQKPFMHSGLQRGWPTARCKMESRSIASTRQLISTDHQ